MVEYPPGTPLWIYCEDGLWWPAAVREADRTSLLGLGEGHDICVEFYHDPGNLCPVVSGNSGVRMFHRVEGERDEDERKLFEVKVTQAAVQRALLDDSRNSLAQKEMVRPYTPKELRCMSALLQSVNHTTASRVREVLLARDGINLSLRNKKQPAARKEIKRRKITPPLSLSPPAESIGLPCDEKMVMVAETNVNSKPTVTLDEPSVSRLQSIFQEPFDPSALDVLRKEVFENKERFVLSPLYRYLDLLGAVFVDGVPVETTLPSPIALHEVPDGGLLPSRRVVLVPLSSCTFDHTEGWMMPFKYESTTIAMTLSVNGTVVETPCNSSLPSGKEAIAVKTASVVDITEHVLDKELFSLVVDFTGFIEDMALWRGVIAVVYVNRVEMDVLIDGIVSNYKIAPRRKEHDDVVGVQVKVSCPITTLPLKIPVRGFSCEHLQCVELRSLLMQCARTNVWNCPLCWAPTRPETIIVNYRLKEWLETHRAQTGKVDFILETPTGMPICPIWKQKRSRGVEDVISLE